MFANPAAGWYHGNHYNAQAACDHCCGVVRHEKWCVTRNTIVQYAYAVVNEPDKLTLRDRLVLHALGVAWGSAPFEGEFQQKSQPREAQTQRNRF